MRNKKSRFHSTQVIWEKIFTSWIKPRKDTFATNVPFFNKNHTTGLFVYT